MLGDSAQPHYTRPVTFALEIHHPKLGTFREECMHYNHLALSPEGRAWRGRIGHRGGSPECLDLSWWHPNMGTGLSFSAIFERSFREEREGVLPTLNGQQVKERHGPLEAGDQLTWREWTVRVSEVPLPGPQERAMAQAARRSDDAMQVYADWLESRGAVRSAEWARLSLDAAGNVERLRDLAKLVGLSFRALVARGPVERCGQRCAQRWEALDDGEVPWRRPCAQCNREVSWCASTEVLASGSGPVVLDPATPRAPGDLLPKPLMVG